MTDAAKVAWLRVAVLAGVVLALEAICRAGLVSRLTLIAPSEMALALGRLRREELERERPLPAREQVTDRRRAGRRRPVGETLGRQQRHATRLENAPSGAYRILDR